jgi:D-arabinose 1-dehydrogenase-like Zn-dependent alcohol dehydrogenase
VSFVEAQGASRVLVNSDGRFHKALGAWRADVVLDCVGQPTFNASLRSARLGGSVTVIGNVVRDKAEVNLGFLVVGGLHVVGSSGATRQDMEALLALHARTPLSFPKHEVMGLSRADEAQRLVQAGGLKGRIVLVPESKMKGRE